MRQHVFLLGYPRSGTTLVEQILAMSDDVVTIEEEPTLALAAEKYLSGPAILKLFEASEAECDALRADYWARVHAAGGDVSGKSFVDMDPFKAPHLPLIARLFPDAKIVLIRRDPRDVVWSCFRQTFAYSAVAVEFTSLERTARHFDAVMRLVEQALAALPLTVHEVQYEELVTDFDKATRALFAFLDLPWSPDVRNFPERARAARVKTASAEQVRRPLYDGSGQWKRHAKHLKPVMPLLERWL
jgi:hypothetical protein